MYLHRVRIENWRGIRRMRLDLDHTTVLVGENAFGKSNVLSALDLLLGVHHAGAELALEPGDLHQLEDGSPAGPLQIELRFVERAEGEWDTASLDDVRPAIVDRDSGRRALTLSLTCPPDDAPPGPRLAFLDGQQELPGIDVPTVFAALRRLNPIVLLGGRSPWPDGDELSAKEQAQGLHPDARRLRGGIRQLFRRLVSHDHPPSEREVDEGIEAVRQALAARPELLVSGGGHHRRLGDLMRTPVRMALGDPSSPHARHGTSAGAARLGPLLLLGAMLEALGPQRLAPGSRPMVLIASAEANLHPIVLASAWSVIESFKAQRLVTTNSPELLAAVPLQALRRLVRRDDHTEVFRLGRHSLSEQELRRVVYHVRMRRGGAFFARAWLLIEGETEAWLLPELARIVGIDFAIEGVHCIEFAQCGVTPLAKLANDLGIPWHLLADGDPGGDSYVDAARAQIGDAPADDRITRLSQRDIEHCLWEHGYEEVYRQFMPRSDTGSEDALEPTEVIARAVRARKKPGMALEVLSAAARKGSPGVPWDLREVIDTMVRLAREGIA